MNEVPGGSDALGRHLTSGALTTAHGDPRVPAVGDPGDFGAASAHDGTERDGTDHAFPADDRRYQRRSPSFTASPGIVSRFAARVLALSAEFWITAGVLVVSCAWVASVLHPRLILADTTPTGGDMGAHVWAPAYLRDHLIPNGRLIGWTPDWYAGFPAFQYYMILPSLAIVLVNVGLVWWQAVITVGAALTGLIWIKRRGFSRLVKPAAAATIVIAVLSIGLPYGISFKIIAVSGLVSMPVSAWAMGRLGGLAFPGPQMLAVATLPFLFDRSFNIYGGNIASTMAGEFAFSMALSLSLVAIGLSIRALDTGKGRGWAAVALALTGLCHLFPAFFALGVVLVYAALRFGRTQIVTLATVLPTAGALGAFWALPFLAKTTYMNDMGWEKLSNFKANLLTRNVLPSDFLRDSPPLEVVFALAVVGALLSIVRRNRLGIAFVVAAAAVALVFIHKPPGRLWNGRMLPFYYLSLYFLAALAISEAIQLIRSHNWARTFAWFAGVGFVAAELLRFVADGTAYDERIGRILPGAGSSAYGALLLGVLAMVLWLRRGIAAPMLACGCGVIWALAGAIPEHWWSTAHGGDGLIGAAGERVVQPVVYAVLHVLRFPAAYLLLGMVLLGVVDLFRNLALGAPAPARVVQLAAAPLVFVALFGVMAPALGSMPFGTRVAATGANEWGVSPFKISTTDSSFLPGWASWNFSGYERRAPSGDSGGYPEFYDLVEMVDAVGADADYGCGRSMWEYGPRLAGYGTPMAPMLLPHYTNGCIGSMEGLYFEASATTPFHFLNQSALSKEPSSAQRDLPYPGFDIDLGVQQLQLMGVRYYLAFSDTAVEAASDHPDLTEIAAAGVWHMYLVADSALVSPLEYEPVVYADVDEHQEGWLQAASVFFNDPTQYPVLRAATGPGDWQQFEIPDKAKLGLRDLAEQRADAADNGEVFTEPVIPDPPRRALDPVVVSNIDMGNDSLGFDVDQVGVPVLVKMSYFPNWRVKGADGPYRVTPNLMVVVPRSAHVELSYGYVPVDLASMAITGLGLIGLACLFLFKPGSPSAPWFDPLEWAARTFGSGDRGGTDSQGPDGPPVHDPLAERFVLAGPFIAVPPPDSAAETHLGWWSEPPDAPVDPVP